MVTRSKKPYLYRFQDRAILRSKHIHLFSSFSTINSLKDTLQVILNAQVALENKIIGLVSLHFKDSSKIYAYRFSNVIFSALTQNRAPLYLCNAVTLGLYNSKS